MTGFDGSRRSSSTEGAIPYATLWELLDKYGGDPNVPDQKR